MGRFFRWSGFPIDPVGWFGRYSRMLSREKSPTECRPGDDGGCRSSGDETLTSAVAVDAMVSRTRVPGCAEAVRYARGAVR